jgi:hypothetical protein
MGMESILSQDARKLGCLLNLMACNAGHVQ